MSNKKEYNSKKLNSNKEINKKFQYIKSELHLNQITFSSIVMFFSIVKYSLNLLDNSFKK